jgi:hypothetical protein
VYIIVNAAFEGQSMKDLVEGTVGKNSRARQGKYRERKAAFLLERRGIVIRADRTTGITPPSTSAMRELANDLKRSGVDVINFAAGELDGDASDLMKTAAKLAIDEGCNQSLLLSEPRGCGNESPSWFQRGAAFPMAPMKLALPPARSKRFTTPPWSCSTQEMKSSFHSQTG